MRFDTIIKNATIVTAIDTTPADVGISGGKISAISAQLSAENADTNDRCQQSSAPPRRHRRPHPSRHAFRRHHQRRRLPDRHDRRSLRRHDDADRFRHSVQRPNAAACLRHLDEKSARQSHHRLRLPLHHHRSWQRATRRNGRPHSRRRHQLQTLHGLSRRLHARRRHASFAPCRKPPSTPA